MSLVVALVASTVGAVVHGVFGSRLPWWSPFGGALTGSTLLLYVCDRMWSEQVSSLLVAQIVLIAITVAIFFSRGPVAFHVGLTVLGWLVVCVRNEPANVAVGSFLAVGPTIVVAALLARWLVGRLLGMVERDPLTGAANRATWNRMATDPHRGRTCVAVIDLDHFKQVNDIQGHAAGDDLLRAVADAWSATLRPSDTLARLGGDEFAVILPGLQLDEAFVVAERLRLRVAELTSTTIGVAARRDTEPLAAVLERADRALYEAKRAGRGRVAVATGVTPL